LYSSKKKPAGFFFENFVGFFQKRAVLSVFAEAWLGQLDFIIFLAIILLVGLLLILRNNFGLAKKDRKDFKFKKKIKIQPDFLVGKARFLSKVFKAFSGNLFFAKHSKIIYLLI